MKFGKKNSIIVSAYCPDDEKKKALNRTLRFLKNSPELEKHWVILCSSFPIDLDLYGLFDFLIFEEENLIYSLGDGISPANVFCQISDNICVYSSFENCKTTLIPAYNKLFHGITFGRFLKSEICHFIEYDTIPSTKIISEIEDNEKILYDGFDQVCYFSRKNKLGAFFSLKTFSDYPSFFTEYSGDFLLEESIRRVSEMGKNSTAEDMVNQILEESGLRIFAKESKDLIDYVSRITRKSTIMAPLYKDEKRGNYGIFIYNTSDSTLEIDSIQYFLGREKIFERSDVILKPSHYFDFPGVLESIDPYISRGDSEIKCYINKVLFANYDLSNIKDRELFFSLNRKGE